MNFKRGYKHNKGEVKWGSPTEYQRNRTPRTLSKRWPKRLCKKLKGEHVMAMFKRTVYRERWFGETGKVTVWDEYACTACGHRDYETRKFNKGEFVEVKYTKSAHRIPVKIQ